LRTQDWDKSKGIVREGDLEDGWFNIIDAAAVNV
jgi:hypothetical protein